MRELEVLVSMPYELCDYYESLKLQSKRHCAVLSTI